MTTPRRRLAPIAITLAASLASLGATALEPPGLRDAAERLTADSGGRAQITIGAATGTAHLVKLAPGAIELGGAEPVTARADAFLARYGALFGVTEPAEELAEVGVGADRLGRLHLALAQRYRGLEVFGGLLRFHFDAAGELTAVNGVFVPGIALDVDPALSAARAAALARAVVGKGRPDLATEVEGLLVFPKGLAQGRAPEPHLAWQVVVAGERLRERVWVDARDGAIVERVDLVETLHRTIHLNTRGDVVWNEGDPLPYSGTSAEDDAGINALIEYSADVFDLYSNLSGGEYLSWNGSDGIMHSIHASTNVECPNAAWDGRQVNFCVEMEVDDVAAHEWTHAYTQGTHGLVYLYQPGALNESYSDVFGEVVDMVNGVGTDVPDLPRTAATCSTYGGNAPPRLTIVAPAGVAGDYSVNGATFNPEAPWSVRASVAYADDGTGDVHDACQTLTGFPSGAIALIDRGECTFREKVEAASSAGASGVIVVNNAGDDIILMGGEGAALSIPAVFLGQSHGATLKQELGNGLEAELSLDTGGDPSIRWLVAEDSGIGALRDMWDPECFGDPTRVTDPRYTCSEGDNGGVHSNSGIPNHAFALLVDGGYFNGVEVRGVGLTKAAHLYWRAMSVYQVPLTEFTDHADALELACADLVGADLPDLVTGLPSGETIDPDDCVDVAAMIAAVELRSEPTQCHFAPVLEAGHPASIGRVELFDEDFSSGIGADWSLDNEGVFHEYEPRDWTWTDDLPEEGEGGAAFALDSPSLGDCRAGLDDQSGVMRLESPPIVLPSRPGVTTLAFDHYVATEGGFDGGNLKISVNGGEAVPIPSSAFAFNPYNTTLDSATDGNTNPLAGEDAFSGANQGRMKGSWGQSQVRLSDLASPGDTVEIRFDFGVDGCGGIDGWYLGRVRVAYEGAPTSGGERVAPARPKSEQGAQVATR